MIVSWDTETEMIPARRTILSKGGKPANVSPYVTPRPVIASISGLGKRERVLDMGPFYYWLERQVAAGEIMFAHNAAFDLDVVYTHGPPFAQAAVMTGLDRGLFMDTMLLDWLVRLARGVFDMPRFNEETRKWFVPQARVRSLAMLARQYLDVELDKDPEVRCGYGQFLDAPSPAAALPEKFRLYAAQDAWATRKVAEALMREVDSIEACPGDSALFGPLSCALQVRADFVARQMDKLGVRVDKDSAAALRARFKADEGPLQERLVELGLGEWAPVPKAARVVEDLPVKAKDILTWTKVK